VTVVAGVAPPGSAGWFDGMAEANVVEFRAAESGEAALRKLIDPAVPVLTGITGAQLLDALGVLLAPADREALGRDAESDVLAAATRQALSTGNDGHVDDDLAFVTDWGFDLGEVHVPVTIWHGEQDRMVPVGHAHRLAEHIEHTTLRLTPGDGHLSIFLNNTHEIVSNLMA
jgi:pimeloyl-ACP methyl ester carboxylesterase